MRQLFKSIQEVPNYCRQIYQKHFRGLSILVKLSPLYSCSLHLIPAKTAKFYRVVRKLTPNSLKQPVYVNSLSDMGLFHTQRKFPHFLCVQKSVKQWCWLWWQGRGGDAGEWEEFLYLFKTKQRLRYVCTQFNKASFSKKTLSIQCWNQSVYPDNVLGELF